jgi:hypothetical protein
VNYFSSRSSVFVSSLWCLKHDWLTPYSNIIQNSSYKSSRGEHKHRTCRQLMSFHLNLSEAMELLATRFTATRRNTKWRRCGTKIIGLICFAFLYTLYFHGMSRVNQLLSSVVIAQTHFTNMMLCFPKPRPTPSGNGYKRAAFIGILICYCSKKFG